MFPLPQHLSVVVINLPVKHFIMQYFPSCCSVVSMAAEYGPSSVCVLVTRCGLYDTVCSVHLPLQ